MSEDRIHITKQSTKRAVRNTFHYIIYLKHACLIDRQPQLCFKSAVEQDFDVTS